MTHERKTLIILLQWHLSRDGIYQAENEKSVVDVEVLETGKMGFFVKDQIMMTRLLG